MDETPRAETDAETASRMRRVNPLDFAYMAKLGGDDAKAVKMLLEESRFIRTHPRRGSEFAWQLDDMRTRWPKHRSLVRGFLIANKLEWTQENLEKASVAAVRPRRNYPTR